MQLVNLKIIFVQVISNFLCGTPISQCTKTTYCTTSQGWKKTPVVKVTLDMEKHDEQVTNHD